MNIFKKIIKNYGTLLLVGCGLLMQLLFTFILKTHADISEYTVVIIILCALVPLIYETVADIASGEFGVDFIALVGIVAALALGEYTAALIILLMLSGGEVLEEYALSKARDGISHLIKLNPTQALVCTDTDTDTERVLPIDQVAIGSLILVKQHEIIPLDGIVEKGTSYVDESKLTGESVPVKKIVDSHVLSGTVNSGGPLYIRTTKIHSESTYQNIIILIEQAQAIKPKFMRIADRYSVVFTIVTFIIVAFVYAFTGDMYRVLLVLVVATPCPLLLAAPTAFASGMSVLARMGVMVQHPDAIERLAKARAFLFDKTGTLTYGTPRVHHIESFKPEIYSEKEIITLLFSVEKFSNHILAESVTKYAQEQALVSYPITDFVEILGEGISATLGKRKILCGKYSFVVGHNKENPSPEQNSDYMYIYISVDDILVGRISCIDEVRPTMKDFIAKLRTQIPLVALVSGDKQARAEQVAQNVGIGVVEAECLPADKVAIVEKYALSHGTVVMVGDGINDAPALTRADVGVVMGSGMGTTATQNGSLVITGDDPAVLLPALHITKRTMRITKQSIVVGLGLSGVLMIAGAFQLFTPVQGALMQELIDIVVILNALRVRWV